MTVNGDPVRVTEAGEYGATTVSLTTDGGNLRIAFGRNGHADTKLYHGAVVLTAEAIIELKAQMESLGV